MPAPIITKVLPLTTTTASLEDVYVHRAVEFDVGAVIAIAESPTTPVIAANVPVIGATGATVRVS